jgi:hypothetical protein
MSLKNIKIVQNILKQEERFDLAIKLENSYYEIKTIEEQDEWVKCTLDLYVHPHYYMELILLKNKKQNHYMQLTSINEYKKLIDIFQGLFDSDTYIDSIEFKINTNIESENITDTTYIFVDESGDMNFTATGSKHYMFNFLVKKRPFKLHEYISNYRYELLEKSLDPLLNRRLNIEYFHAHNDNKHIRKELFNIISTFDTQAVKIYSYILEKEKVQPEKRAKNEDFYIDNLIYSISKLLEKIEISSNFVIITDNLPVAKNRKKQEKALKVGVTKYLKEHSLNLRYDIFHHCSASSANLQIIDYIGWAIYRKYEHKNDMDYKTIKKYILAEDIVTKSRGVKYYEK